MKKNNKRRNSYMVYCDGACEPNPGTGGYCSIIIESGEIEPSIIITGGEKNTTNNRMEIMGALSAFRVLKYSSEVVFYSDSQYVCNSINRWLAKWKATRRTMKNMDLWNSMWDYKQKHKVKAVWVKGHSGNIYNELADALSLQAIAKIKCMKKKTFQEVKNSQNNLAIPK